MTVYAKRRDENEAVIRSALCDAGAHVWQIGWSLDLLVAFRGRFYILECKSKDGKLRDGQVETLRQMEGCPVFVVREIDEALQAIGAVEYKV
jgi:hypothetical protein